VLKGDWPKTNKGLSKQSLIPMAQNEEFSPTHAL
jgi:hypothetical protein